MAEGQEVVDQTAGGSPTTEPTPSAAKTNDQTPAPKAAPGTSPVNEDYEKRFKGLTSDLQKERAARQKYERDLAAARAEVESERRRVAALAGVAPKSQVEQDEEQIKQRFAALYPELAGLTKEDIAALRELKARSADLEETTRHHWTTHTTKMVDQLHGLVEKELGGKLTDRQKQRIARAYAVEAEGNEEFLDRHSKGDPTLLQEFAQQWVEDWFEPARRKVTQQETQRFRAVPTGKDRGIITHGEKKIDVNDSKAVEDFLVKGFRERNGEFGRR